MTTQVTLERDGHDQPWGFRLQGGVDVGLPLSVLRVLVGTPAEPVLKKGDVISKIGSTGTHGLSHQKAADLFNSAGNQLLLTVKRSGAGGAAPSAAAAPKISAIQASAAIKSQASAAAMQSGAGIEKTSLSALPKTQFVLKSDLPPAVQAPSVLTQSSEQLSVQNQPYRTTPLVQPSVKVITELGIGSYSHLKLQEEICSGAREPQLVPVSPAQANAIKANEFIMKQKTQQGLVSAASDHQKSTNKSAAPFVKSGGNPLPKPTPLPVKATSAPAKYNTAKGLYASPASGYLDKKPGMINPSSGAAIPPPVGSSVNKPNKNLPLFGLSKKYDPEQSATWQAIHEEENCKLITEHGPTESKVYSI